MFTSIRQLFRAQATVQALPRAAVPAGQRVYAIGDIHGRLDLFEALLARIEADDADRGAAETTIILLGDIVDRGPQSAGMIAAARRLAARRRTRFIGGNHEEMFLDSFERIETLRHFLRFGGRETILSYPVPLEIYRELSLEETQLLMQQVIPAEDIEFLRSFEEHIIIGDYLFVHAGIRPDVPLGAQEPRDFRWIREPFLSFTGDLGWCVVHGHSISKEVEFCSNRIGIDTGAYETGRLTAIGLEGTGRWLIETAEADGVVTTDLRQAA